MDYFGILKKGWKITWKYKALWVLGLFAGAGSGSSSGGNSYQQSGDQMSTAGDQFTRWAGENIVLIAVVVGLLVVIGFLFWVLSIAAQAGLVYGANQGAEDRAPSLRECWRAGFGKWGRTFMIGFVLGIPVFVVVMVMIGLFVVLGVGGAASGEEAAGAAILGGVCFVLPLFLVIIVALSLMIGITYQLALRYGVIEDVTFGQAIKRGWGDLWAKRGAFMMWLVMLLPGFAVGMVMLLVMMPFLIPMIAMIVAEKYVMAVAFGVLMWLVMLVPTAIYGTFVSSSWTVFFRQMTGLEPTGAALLAPPAYATPMAPPAYAPPAPPVAEEPAPPVTEQPAAPPAEEAPPTDG